MSWKNIKKRNEITLSGVIKGNNFSTFCVLPEDCRPKNRLIFSVNQNSSIMGKFSEKKKENIQEIYEENKEDNKEETNEETKEENKEESKEEESKNMSNLS